MNKALKKLLPTLALIVVTASLMGTSTFAWFTMNTQVEVKGMKLHIDTYNNLLVAADTGTANSNAEANFKNVYDFADASATKYAPVSTVDGLDFYYITNKNATAAGTKIEDNYLQYDATDTTSDNSFAKQYKGKTAYKDYSFQLKAINGDVDANGDASESDTPMQLRLTTLELKYAGGTSTALSQVKAFRIAVFMEEQASKYPTSGYTGSNPHVDNFAFAHAGDARNIADSADNANLKSIYTPNGAANFTVVSSKNQAVKAGTPNPVLGDVTYNAITASATNYMSTVAEDTAKYYKVTVRIWIEGEDTTCFNEAYITLDNDWDLTLKFDLVEGGDTTTNNVSYIDMTYTA